MFKNLNLIKLFIFLLFPIISNSTLAQTAAEIPTQAKKFVEELANNALNALNDVTLNQMERDEKFRQLLKEGFDVEYIGKLVLGRFGRRATNAEMQEFKVIFPEYIIKISAGRLNQFGDAEYKIGGTAPAGKRDVYVQSKVIRNDGPPVSADWRVRRVNGKFKIIDLKIEGISMVLTQRDEFSGKISRMGMEGLLKELEKQSGLR